MDEERQRREQKAEMQRTLDEHMRHIMTKKQMEEDELNEWRRKFTAWCERMDREAAEAEEAQRIKNKKLAVEVQAWNKMRYAAVEEEERKEK